MILFLDTVSSLPEFSLIEDNKIIYSHKILGKHNDKMSDCLLPSYLKLEKKFSLNTKLQLLLVNTGPGSYTALRVGIAFFSGLSLSQNIDLIGLPCVDLFRLIVTSEDLNYTGICISSSNNQIFICFFNIKQNKLIIKKIDKNLDLDKQNIDLSFLKIVYTNEVLHESFKNFFLDIDMKIIKFSEIVSHNIVGIKKYKKNKIISPIYYSDNRILN